MNSRSPEQQETHRQGLLAGSTAYLIWGLLPGYFRLLSHVSIGEVVGQRIVWALFFVATALFLKGEIRALWRNLCTPSVLLPMLCSAAFIVTNWTIYIYAAVNHHILAASLGYFLNPLVNVLLGVLIFKERLNYWQKVAVALAFAGVMMMAFAALDTVWISLVLALTFAFYGLVRKLAPVGAMQGLAVETCLLAPLATLYLVVLSGEQGLAFINGGTSVTVLLIFSGILTSLPLILFSSAARSLPMVTLGLLQYIAPTLQFIVGWAVFQEPLSANKLASFAIIWVALAIFAMDMVWRRGRAAPVIPPPE
jgi:chloramphenicol-sensitive protein RarD